MNASTEKTRQSAVAYTKALRCCKETPKANPYDKKNV